MKWPRAAAMLLVAASGPALAAGEPLAPLAPRLGSVPSVVMPARSSRALAETLEALAEAGPGERQQARWDHALALLGEDRAAEALGVFDVMRADEPDLALSSSFSLARGRALVELGRAAEAAAALDRPSLAGAAEACAWRLLALEQAGAHRVALRQMPCAKPALVARNSEARTPFLIAAARAANAAGRPYAALHWLGFADRNSPEAAVVKGRALLLQGRRGQAAAGFGEALARGSGPIRAEAELGLIEAALAGDVRSRKAASVRLDRLLYRWRGDGIEQRALWLAFDLGRRDSDSRRALRSAAALVRYHSPGARTSALLEEARSIMERLLAPDARLPLDQTAGLYWEFRDLAPGGADGDRLAYRLAGRLQQAGLYERAAGLLEHQLTARARDVAQGPLSVRVARLHILSGHPHRALDALRLSSETIYPAAMDHDRRRIEAVALQLVGRGGEALALLQEVPGSAALQAELLWKQKSWAALADLMERLPGAGRRMGEAQEALVLRQAITLGMLGREQALALLRSRYSGHFATPQSERAFELLTRPAGELDADGLAAAMAAIPSASPAGEYADLLEVAPVARTRRS